LCVYSGAGDIFATGSGTVNSKWALDTLKHKAISIRLIQMWNLQLKHGMRREREK
jgi:hypothetical protein